MISTLRPNYLGGCYTFPTGDRIQGSGSKVLLYQPRTVNWS
ncbi:hypothetical protein [Coleofasciculus sp. FACHB-SPT9]|nr:hypothetical protein [Coleofasciculus sp. FACHB-SPT9]